MVNAKQITRCTLVDRTKNIKKERKKNMKIAFDLHGTLDANISFFQKLLRLLRYMDEEIYIISGPPLNEIHEQLQYLSYEYITHYEHMISIIDFLKFNNVPIYQDKSGNWWTYKEEDWWSSKSLICQQYAIDVIIDDCIQYQTYFNKTKTRFILFEQQKEDNFTLL